MTPDQYCQHRAAPHGSSLHYALLFLPPERRRAAIALHAFRREVGVVVQECSDPQLARTTLAWWRVEVAGMVAGKPQHPVTRALEPALAPYAITEAQLDGIIDGMEMDLAWTRYADFAGLERYCKLVSGVPAQLASGIFGRSNPRTLDYAQDLGTALRLASIIRDIGEDARRNRIYLPMEDLKAHGVTADDILRARYSDAFASLMRFQAARAKAYCDRALSALPTADRRAQHPGLIMASIQRTLLEEIERDGFRVLAQRTSLTPMRKLWLACRTWLAG